MKDYYSILNIAKNASPAEIKKAYFKLVRAFPPDRHSQEFMKIREAYEVLIDENTRREYDQIDAMPAVVKFYFNEGCKALSGGDVTGAIQLLEMVIKSYPRFSIVNSLLGEAYLKNENSVKAIRIFEKLVEQEPQNAGFARQLAHAYAMRGWYRKAIERYRRALSLDEDNISLWLGLINCFLETDDFGEAQKTAREGLEVSNRKGWDNLELYYHIIQIDIYNHDYPNMRKHLEEMKKKALEKEEERVNVAWFLATLSKKIYSAGFYAESAATIDAAFTLQPDDEEIQNIKSEIDSEQVIRTELKKLKEELSIDSHLAEMLDSELHLCDDKDCLECDTTRFFFELDIIAGIEKYRREILRLKNSYPELYSLKKEFFDKVLNRKKEGYLLDTYAKNFKKYKKLIDEKFGPEDYYDYDDYDDYEDDEEYEEGQYELQQPYRRSEPKIGRNDPCPCGSGKKYKKCCGR